MFTDGWIASLWNAERRTSRAHELHLKVAHLQVASHLLAMDFYFSFEAFQSLLLSISIDPGTEKHGLSSRILMSVRQRRRWFVQHMLPHWLFITAACYEESLHPSSSSNEFLHAELNSASGHLEWAVCEEDKDWAAIIAYYVSAVQAWHQRNEADARWRTAGGS